MVDVLGSLLWAFVTRILSPSGRDAELIVLRHQVRFLHRKALPRLKLTGADRLLFAVLYRLRPEVLQAIVIVKPETVVRWHRQGFRAYWRRKSCARPGRPRVSKEVQDLIREIGLANPLWGAPRIHGELLKLGIDVAQSTVGKYLPKRRGPPGQSWRTFLKNHADGITCIDLFVVSTATMKLLFGLIIMRHGRRRLVHTAVTAHPTAEWLARQISEAFPWDTQSDYLIRDRDSAYGEIFKKRVRAMGIQDRPIAPRSPWQNGHAERLIGSVRRECLDYVIILNEAHLRRVLKGYADYNNHVRTHLSLDKDAPYSRPVIARGAIRAGPYLGGLHHAYLRI
jgi:transposase InsO family protein